MSYEDFLARKIDRDRRTTSRENLRDTTFDDAHEKARTMFANPTYAIQTPDFFDLYEEVYQQLRSVQSYAAGKGRGAIADSYARSLDLIEKIRDKKRSVSLAHIEHDPVFAEIMAQTRTTFSA